MFAPVLNVVDFQGCPEPYSSPSEYRAHASRILAPLMAPRKSLSSHSSAATLVYPLSQLAPLSTSSEDNLSTERIGVGYVLDVLSERRFQGGNWVFTAGYFNPSKAVKRGLIYGTSTKGTVINASAEVIFHSDKANSEANGFYNSPNPSGYLPDAYMILARQFLENVERAGMKDSIKMEEWRHVPRDSPLDGWTYHAKGTT